MKGNLIYGPCHSRRLGVSLGVDIIPHKTCSLDCIYCECGPTTCLTAERKEYLPIGRIIDALKNILRKKPVLDYVTFAGSGEPTLNLRIGEIIGFLKEEFPRYPVAVITNSAGLKDPKVIHDIRQADLIIPSLDAVSQEVFEKINRPLSGLKASDLLAGIQDLKRSITGRLWLEIFIVPGLNDTEEELDLFRSAIKNIQADKVQLNSLDRPAAVNWVKGVSKERLQEIARRLGPVEIIP